MHVTAKDNTEREPITYDAKHGWTRKASADEMHQLRSFTQSLAWIGRKHDLISHIVFERCKTRSKMLLFETFVNAIVF